MKHKTIIVGAGFMGRVHGANLAHCDALELAAWVNRHKVDFSCSTGNLATPMASESAGKPFFDDLKTCLAQVRPQAAVICVPTVAHMAATELCLEHGCHVLLEKPITLDEEAGARMIRLAADKNLVFMVAHCVRFTPVYRYLAAAVREQRFGKLQYLHLTRFCARPEWGNWQDPQVAAGSGGALYDLLIHDVDFAYSVLGKPDDMQQLTSLKHFRGDLTDAVWSYADGAMVQLTGGHMPGRHYPFHCGYAAIFERGTLYYTSERPDLLNVDGESVDFSGETDGYLGELNYFNDCVKHHCDPVLSSASDGLEAIRLCNRMFHERSL